MDRVGPYSIEGELGRGGMAVVYRARRDGEFADVALKVVGGGAGGDPAGAEQLARFQREVRIAQSLKHPGLVRVLEAGGDDTTAWFAMELVDGESLAEAIRTREFSWREAVTIVREVAAACAVAHDRGVLHRDVKPSNILLEADGRPRLTDFGLAKDTRTGSKFTRSGDTLGTPAYMSPEQARGDLAELSPASDVWSLGCVLYELLAGRPPFRGETAAAIVGHVVTGEPEPLAGVPAHVQALVAWCLRKRPERRPQSAEALREACERVLAGGAPAPRSLRRFGRPAVAGLLLAGAAVAAWQWNVAAGRSRDARAAEEAAARVAEATRQAGQLAERAWALRHADPAGACAGLERALQQLPDRHEWRLRLGLARWACGEDAAAEAAWAGVPDGAPEATRAWWLRGLASAVRALDFRRPEDFQAARAAWRHAAQGTGPEARWAAAGLALDAGQSAAPRKQLRNETSWEAALLFGLAEVAVKESEQDHAAVVRAFSRVLSNGLPLPGAFVNRGSAKQSQGDLAGALADYTAALAVAPHYVKAYANRALVHLARGDAEAALADYGAILAIDPRNVEALTERAVALTDLGRIAAALADLEAALTIQPDHLRALAARGYARRQGGDPAGAIADFDAALAKQPGDVNALYHRALAKAATGDAAGAHQDYTRALKVDPRYVDAWVNRGNLRRRMGDPEGALADYARALAIDASNGRALLGRGNLRMDRGDLAGALAEFRAALEADPNYLMARAGVAYVKTHQRDFAGALAEYDRLIALAPDNAEYVYGRALAKQRAGDEAGALADYATALRLKPDYVEAFVNRGLIHMTRGRTAEALADFEAGVKRNPNHPKARCHRGNARAKLGDLDGARADYDAAVQLEPRYALAWLQRGVLRRRRGDYAGAAKDLAQALAVAPKNWPVRANVEQLLQTTRAAAGGK